MDYTIAREKLLNHANLTYELSTVNDEESLLFTFWHAQKDKKFPQNLNLLTLDIIECLTTVNRNWNGEIPSETSDGLKNIDRHLVYAVNQIILGSWEYSLSWQKAQLFEQSLLQEVTLMVWTISRAWNAVLAGDIDDIKREVEIDKMAQTFFDI